MFKIAIIGIEGFGRVHVRQIAALAKEGLLQCVAFADPKPQIGGESFTALTEIGAVHYTIDADMLEACRDLDFVVIATPIPLHKPMAVRWLRAGVHVLVEKPPAVTVQDLDEIIAARAESGKVCAVNFQNVTGQAFRRAIEEVRGGAVGRVRRVTGVGMWKRTNKYYARTPWAGKLALNGQLILDGTLINPFAHLLQNSFLLAGAESGPAAAEPVSIQAELYHANPIESEDTACLRAELANGAVLSFYTTLAYGGPDVPPYIEVAGDRGVLRWNYDNTLVIRRGEGEAETIQYPAEVLVRNTYLNVMDSVSGRGPLLSPIDNCRSFMVAVNGAFESSAAVNPIPEEALERQVQEDETAILIRDIPRLIADAAERGALFSECGIPWAVPSRKISCEGYREFHLNPAGFGHSANA